MIILKYTDFWDHECSDLGAVGFFFIWNPFRFSDVQIYKNIEWPLNRVSGFDDKFLKGSAQVYEKY